MNIPLTPEELTIEQDADNLISLTGKKRKKIENVLAKAKKNCSISLINSAFALDKLKEKANNQGMPYQNQTLIQSILKKNLIN